MKFEFEAIGTHWMIDVVERDDFTFEHDELLAKISERIEKFDKNYSRFRDDSLVSEIARAAGEYELPEDAQPLFDFYKQLYELTGGLLTPLIGTTLEQAGYDKNYSLESGELQTPPAWKDVLHYDFPILKTQQPVLLDFGAAGKGYLIDIIGQLLQDNGITSFTIDAGGDILHRASEVPESSHLDVGLEDPLDESQAIGVAKIANQSIAGSSGNRRKWANFHHIINPSTLQSVQDISAVWVVAKTAMLTDGLATALYLMPQPELFSETFEFEFLILFPDRSIMKSDNFPAELFFNT